MMELVLIAALVAVNIAYILHLERKDRRVDEQVNRLLQRIQAPQQAVVDYAPQTKPEGPLYSNEWAEEQQRLEELFAEDGER